MQFGIGKYRTPAGLTATVAKIRSRQFIGMPNTWELAGAVDDGEKLVLTAWDINGKSLSGINWFDLMPNKEDGAA